MNKHILGLLALVWMMKSFAFASGVTAFLNTLPPERAAEAKVIVANDSRDWFHPYMVYYRAEQ